VEGLRLALRRSCRVGGQLWSFEAGRLAGLAHGACLVTVGGGTSVLSTAVVSAEPQLQADGVPLQVRAPAAGGGGGVMVLGGAWCAPLLLLSHACAHTAPGPPPIHTQHTRTHTHTPTPPQHTHTHTPPQNTHTHTHTHAHAHAPHTQVEYRERLTAVGRLPLRPDRRERTGTDREVLAARLIDRALRPLLPPGFLYDTQVRRTSCERGGG
jgi:hypothetical protein